MQCGTIWRVLSWFYFGWKIIVPLGYNLSISVHTCIPYSLTGPVKRACGMGTKIWSFWCVISYMYKPFAVHLNEVSPFMYVSINWESYKTYRSFTYATSTKWDIYSSLSTVVLDSRDWPKKMAFKILKHPKSTLE